MVAGATPAWSAEPTPPARDTTLFACPPGEVPDPGFVDIANQTFELQIECLAWYDITQGGPGGIPSNQYGPAQSVTRAQMASFIARSLDYLDPALLGPYDGSNEFTDVEDNSVHVAAINRLAEVDIARGGAEGNPATTYSPQLPVGRDQMASFIARSLGFVFEANFCVNVRDYFDDDNGNVHEPCINGLADVAVVVGISFGNYNPDGRVTRAQMSGFIMRMMDIFVEQELAETPAERANAT
jgi:hypothetical protein